MQIRPTQRPAVIDNPAGLLAPGAQKQIEARIKTIDRILTAGLVEPRLERALTAERARLQKTLLAGVAGPGARLVSPDFQKKLEGRLQEIDRILMTALLTPAAERKLQREKSAIEKLLRASAAGQR